MLSKEEIHKKAKLLLKAILERAEEFAKSEDIPLMVGVIIVEDFQHIQIWHGWVHSRPLTFHKSRERVEDDLGTKLGFKVSRIHYDDWAKRAFPRHWVIAVSDPRYEELVGSWAARINGTIFDLEE